MYMRALRVISTNPKKNEMGYGYLRLDVSSVDIIDTSASDHFPGHRPVQLRQIAMRNGHRVAEIKPFLPCPQPGDPVFLRPGKRQRQDNKRWAGDKMPMLQSSYPK
jgi:hypothetical protein